jgi:hypothetical protein
MPKVRYKPRIEYFQGTVYDVVFRRSPQRKPIVKTRPDMSNVKWSKAQKAQRERFRQANEYAKDARAEPKLWATYERMAKRQHERAWEVAMSDYFQGKDLLSKSWCEEGLVPAKVFQTTPFVLIYSPSNFKRANRSGSCSTSQESSFKI